MQRESSMVERVIGYNVFAGSGWRQFGRLVVNFHEYRVISVWFNGERLADSDDLTHVFDHFRAVWFPSVQREYEY